MERDCANCTIDGATEQKSTTKMGVEFSTSHSVDILYSNRFLLSWLPAEEQVLILSLLMDIASVLHCSVCVVVRHSLCIRRPSTHMQGQYARICIRCRCSYGRTF